MENTLYLAAMNGTQLAIFLAVMVGCWGLGLIVFFLFYGACSLAPGLSMRLGYTFGLLMFWVSAFFAFRDITPFFAWWRYSPGPTTGVLGDAILLIAVSLIWLLVIWTAWPRPRPASAF